MLVGVGAVVVACGAAWRATGRRGGRPTRSRAEAAVGRDRALILAGVALGGILGTREAAVQRASCTAELRSGDRVMAAGVVGNRAGAAGRGRIRLRLRDVRVRSDGRHCRVTALLARATVDGGRPPPGSAVRVTGTWMRFADGTAWPARPDRQGMITGRATRVDAATAAIVSGGSATLPIEGIASSRPLLRLRARAARRLAARLPADVAPTALALVLAEQDEIEPDLRRRFVDSGLAHHLAISGMHIALLGAAGVWLLGFVLGVRSRVPVALALISAYVMLIGAPASACRALVVFAGYAWARRRGWPARGGELLGLALLVMTVTSPSSLLGPGLQLSFAGFAGVVLGGRVAGIVQPGRSRGAVLARSAGAGAGAILATTPITAFHFGQATPVALLSNFIGGPLVSVALGSLAAVLALPAFLAAPAADVATGALRALHATAELFSRVPGGHQDVAAPAVAVWIGWGLVLEGLRRIVVTGRARAACAPALLAAAVVAAGPVLAGVVSGPALLCTLSVGQGDAAALRTSRGRWMVFDGGPAWDDWNAGTAIVLPFLRRHGAHRIELAVLSHAHLDHLGGLRGLVPEIPVERVLDTGHPAPSEMYREFLAVVDASGVQWLPAAPGDQFRIDDARLTVLGPAAGEERSGANATSLSFRLTVGRHFRYVNTGDAPADQEASLLAAWPADSLRADVLKVGHHGSRTSSTAAFLRAVAPDLAVISSGARNRYGHPHSEALARLHAADIGRVWRTDRHGTLCVEIDENGRWRVQGEPTWREADDPG